MRSSPARSTSNSRSGAPVEAGVMRWVVTGFAAAGIALAPCGMAAATGEGAPATAEAGGSPDAEASCADDVARRVQDHYQDVRGLTARFEQQSQVVSLGTGPGNPATASRGEVSFAKPGRMRWSYESPEPSLVVTDGEVLWLYDPEAREAQRLHAGQGFLSGAALQFLLGEGDMTRDFSVRALECGPDQARLSLVPRKEAPYERLELTVDARSGAVRETAVFDLVGNVTRVVFSDVRLDPGLADEAFQFVPPPGVKVVEVPAPEP